MSTVTDPMHTPAPTSEEGLRRFEAELQAEKRRRRTIVQASRFVLIVLSLLAWEVFSGPPDAAMTLIDEFYVSTPSQMIASIGSWLDQGILWQSILVTLQETVIGFVIGAALGMAAGFALGVSGFLSAVLTPIVAALYSIPRLALIPLFLLWFGLGLASKLALVVTVVFFLVFYNTYSGVKDVDNELLDVLRVMGAKPWHRHLKVTLPSAMTWIVAGLRVSVPYALVAAVTGEMISSNRGMGFLIIRASGQFNTAGVFGGILVLMVIALGLTGVVTFLEKRLLGWRNEGMQAEAGW